MTINGHNMAITLLSVLLIVGIIDVSAQDDPEAAIKYRQNHMRAQSGHLGAMVLIVKGDVEQRSHLSQHAKALRTLTTFIVDVFPEGSDLGETRAKEEIWDDFEAFTETAKRAEVAAAELAAVAESGDQGALEAKLATVADSCKGCHKKYRTKK